MYDTVRDSREVTSLPGRFQITADSSVPSVSGSGHSVVIIYSLNLSTVIRAFSADSSVGIERTVRYSLRNAALSSVSLQHDHSLRLSSSPMQKPSAKPSALSKARFFSLSYSVMQQR